MNHLIIIYILRSRIDDFADGGLNEYDCATSDHRPVALKLSVESNFENHSNLLQSQYNLISVIGMKIYRVLIV